MGGISTWTEIIRERELPKPFQFEIIDTRVTRASPDSPGKFQAKEIGRNLKILLQVFQQLRTGDFSVMHLNCSLTPAAALRNCLSAMLAVFAKTPYVAHLHGTLRAPTGRGFASFLYRRAWRVILCKAASIVVLGRPSYHSVLEWGNFGQKTVPFLPNFVDFRSVSQAAPGATVGGRLKVLFTGALIETKGPSVILTVASRVPDAEFELVGGGPRDYRASLIRRIAELGLKDRVRLSGPISRDEVLAKLAEQDVFFFPSGFAYEGFPNSVAEAMAAGLPVIASNVGAIPEMVDVSKGGYLFAPDDVAGYVEALHRLRDEPALRARMGEYNRRKALREYDYDVVVGSLCETWSRAANEN